MRLYLVQHGEAKSKDEDPDRHLTEKGKNDVMKIAAFLRPLNVQVSVIWHSDKPRAAQTAEILNSALTSNDGVIRREGLAPNNPISPVILEIEKCKTDLMLVGHLPFLQKLASKLVKDNESFQVVGFKQGGIVCLERMEEDGWSVKWMMVPELLH